MSQILEKPRTPENALIQDIFSVQEKSYLSTNAAIASCYVCDKGLKDGHSLTAKIIGNETVLLCNVHNSKNYWIGFVIAPSAAEPTSDANFANAPDV